MRRQKTNRSRTAPGPGRHARSHDAAAAVDAAVASCAAGVGRPAPHLVEPLASGDDAHRGAVERALAAALVAAVAGAWRIGWQPADLHRGVARVQGRPHAALVVRAIAREARNHAPGTVPARWRLQLDSLGAGLDDQPPGPGGPAAWVLGPDAAAGDEARVEAVVVAVETIASVRLLPRMPKLGPVPGDPPAAATARGIAGVGADPRVLHKVTSLLAKAESTTFPDEAEALTAKAQELMTRHAIDRATLDARAAPGGAGTARGRVGGRRVGIDDPYAGARYLLLSEVAETNRCKAVWSKYWGFATVFGDEGDLDAVEMLYTSLLVQATRAMVAKGPPLRGDGPGGPGGRGNAGGRGGAGGRTRSFRQSFLVAFARRIGARLRQAAEAAVTEAATRGGNAALVPLFAERRRAADEAVSETFPSIGTTRMSARDGDGWYAGTAAADRAQLDVHEALRR
jgi:hypothetical protein